MWFTEIKYKLYKTRFPETVINVEKSRGQVSPDCSIFIMDGLAVLLQNTFDPRSQYIIPVCPINSIFSWPLPKLAGVFFDGKLSFMVWGRGKGRDNIKALPIVIVVCFILRSIRVYAYLTNK